MTNNYFPQKLLSSQPKQGEAVWIHNSLSFCVPRTGKTWRQKCWSRRKISTLCKSKEAETTERLGDDEPEARLGRIGDVGRRETERLIEIRDLFKEVIALLFQHPKVQRSEDLQLLVRALAKGLWETAELSKETRLETKRIHQLKRELRDIYPGVAEKITKDGESVYE